MVVVPPEYLVRLARKFDLEFISTQLRNNDRHSRQLPSLELYVMYIILASLKQRNEIFFTLLK